MTISTRKAVKIFLVIDLQPCNTNYSTPRGYVPRRARIPLFILKGNIVSVSKYFMLRPSSLDWDFIEKHYPNYYRSNAILKSDDMSYCLGDMGDVPRDTVITEESYEAFEEYAEDLAYRVENGFADFIGSGLDRQPIISTIGCMLSPFSKEKVVFRSVRRCAFGLRKSTTHLQKSADNGTPADCRLIPSRLMPNVC